MSAILSILLYHSYFQLNALKPGIYRFSQPASLLALSVFLFEQKQGCGDHLDFINFNQCNFLLNALKPIIYRFSGSASLLALSIFMHDQKNKALAAMFS